MSNKREKVNLTSAEGGDQPQQQVIPADNIPLPSRGRVYGLNHPFHDVLTVPVKAMTAMHEDILTSVSLMKSGKTFSELIKSCLLDRGVDPDTLLIGDKNALLIGIRCTGYGEEYVVDATCPFCSHTFQNSFDLSKLPIKELGQEPVAPGENEFELVLPLSKKKVTFKLSTSEVERRVERDLDEMRKKTGSESPVTTTLLAQLVSVDGVRDESEIAKFVRVMPAGDSRKLRLHMDTIAPGVEMTQKLVCKNPICGREAEVIVPLGTELFWPST